MLLTQLEKLAKSSAVTDNAVFLVKKLLYDSWKCDSCFDNSTAKTFYTQGDECVAQCSQKKLNICKDILKSYMSFVAYFQADNGFLPITYCVVHGVCVTFVAINNAKGKVSTHVLLVRIF